MALAEIVQRIRSFTPSIGQMFFGSFLLLLGIYWAFQRLTMKYTVGNSIRQTECQLFASYAKELGVTVNVSSTDDLGASLTHADPQHDYDVIVFAWVGTPFFASGNASNYNTGGGRPVSPEEKLANSQWKVLNSWWILPSIFSCGALGWLGFFVAALQTRKTQYWVSAGIYAALFALFLVFSNVTSSGVAVIPFFAAWIGPAIHAAIGNGNYLRALAYSNAR